MKRTEHTQKWLDALRGGEYKQTRLTLCDDEGYCCIGVAAHVIGKCDILDKNSGYIAAEQAMGMSYDESHDLMALNDFDRKTFHEIADAIEQMIEADTNGN